MMAHIPIMEYLSNCGDDTIPLKVLVIGGGDGYIVSELLRYPQIQHIDHVELDVHVVNVSKEHLHWGSYTWHDKRVNLVIEDGATFVQQQVYNKHQYYHVIIQDAGDPFWYNTHGDITTLPSSVLYTSLHFINLYKLLQPKGGVLMFQAETYNIPSNLHAIRNWRVQLQDIGFGNVRYGTVSIGTYSTGQLGFLTAHVGDGNEQQEVCGSNDDDSIPPCDTATTDSTMQTTQQKQAYRMDIWPEIKWRTIQSRYKQMTGKTRYYHPRIHRSSFDLPLWVEEYIYGDDDNDDRGGDTSVE
jgi:spermidine synthase